MNPAETSTPSSMKALVIGGSAGAVGALMQLLPELPAGYPLAVLVVIHLPHDDQGALTELLNGQCRMSVKEAEDKEPILPGVICVAPANYHLLVEPDFHVSLSQDDPVYFSRPSIDVLFESAADAYGRALAGVILSGASPDGAHGLQAVQQAGGKTFVQDPATAVATTMPLAALAACPEACGMPLREIARALGTLAPPPELPATPS
jgi:two-component system chemotaxis response regulator CheB